MIVEKYTLKYMKFIYTCFSFVGQVLQLSQEKRIGCILMLHADVYFFDLQGDKNIVI